MIAAALAVSWLLASSDPKPEVEVVEQGVLHNVPEVVYMNLWWVAGKTVRDPDDPTKQINRTPGIDGEIFFQSDFDTKRFRFVMDGVDLAPYILSKRKSLDDSLLKSNFHVEKRGGRAEIEFAIYRKGVSEPVLERKFSFRERDASLLPLDQMTERSPSRVEARTFKRDAIPPDLREFAPPEYREKKD